MSAVSIDRLILALPGMTEEAARALALGVAEGLAGAAVSGDFETLTVEVDPAIAKSPDALSAHIVQSLLQRIG
jgi:hypothetical protein